MLTTSKTDEPSGASIWLAFIERVILINAVPVQSILGLNHTGRMSCRRQHRQFIAKEMQSAEDWISCGLAQTT